MNKVINPKYDLISPAQKDLYNARAINKFNNTLNQDLKSHIPEHYKDIRPNVDASYYTNKALTNINQGIDEKITPIGMPNFDVTSKLKETLITDYYITKEEYDKINALETANNEQTSIVNNTPNLEEQKTPELPTIENTNMQNKQYTENTNTANDRVYDDNAHDKLFTEAHKSIKQLESNKDIFKYPYIDKNGFITIGDGLLIDDKDTFYSFNWKKPNGQSPTKEEIDAYYNKLSNVGKNNKKAKTYKTDDRLELSQNDLDEMFAKHIVNDLKILRNKFDGFNELPFNLQLVLIDIRFNTGSVTVNNWGNLIAAIKEEDVEKIRYESKRAGLPERNKWVEKMLEDLRF